MSHLPENLVLLRDRLLEWCQNYDLEVEENRSAVCQWVEFFRAAGDPEFANLLHAMIDKKKSA